LETLDGADMKDGTEVVVSAVDGFFGDRVLACGEFSAGGAA